MSRRASQLLLLTVALTGCGGSFFQTKATPPALYLLSATATTPAAAAAAPRIPADLAVLRPRVRAGLDSDRIAALYPDRRLEYFADARWSGPLDEVIQQLAVQQFHATANLRNVSVEASVFASNYRLEIEVVDFQAEYSGAAPPTVHVHFLARVGASADRHILAAFDASAKVAASDNRMSAIVDAYNRAAEQALAEIISGTVQALSTR
jgi:cholesterol transport system auxiliary component